MSGRSTHWMSLVMVSWSGLKWHSTFLLLSFALTIVAFAGLGLSVIASLLSRRTSHSVMLGQPTALPRRAPLALDCQHPLNQRIDPARQVVQVRLLLRLLTVQVERV